VRHVVFLLLLNEYYEEKSVAVSIPRMKVLAKMSEFCPKHGGEYDCSLPRV
jgi:hypothetical protein